MPTQGRRDAGFTLLELVVVLVLVAALFSVAVPVLSAAFPGLQARAAARDLAASLRQAQDQALASNRVVTWSIELVDGGQSTVRSGALATQLPASLRVTAIVPGGLSDGRRAVIRFYPDGSSTGGIVTLSGGTREYRIVADWLTGRVLIDD